MIPRSPRLTPRSRSRSNRPPRYRAVLRGHEDQVTGALVLSNGRFLSWSQDATLRPWRPDGTSDGEPFCGHADRIEGAIALSDGRFLSWSRDQTLRLWRPDGTPDAEPLRGHTYEVAGALELPRPMIDFSTIRWTE